MNIKDKIYSNISYNTNELITKIDLALIAAGVVSMAALLPNDTTIEYLTVSGISMLNSAYLLFSINSEEHTKEIQQIKKLYQEFLSEYVKLNKKLELQHPLELYTLYNKMLQSGYLSKDKTFHFGDTNVKDIRGISPTNVINGEAVCRHIAVMLKDIYNAKELLGLQYSLNGNDWFNYNDAINLGNINAGANITVYFRAKVNASVRGNVLNTVNITTGVDDARGNFTDNETINVMANTTLVVIKDAEIKALNPGDTAHFVITVIAGGSSDSLNVKLEDILDAELLDVKSATYRINGGNLTDYTQIISLGNMHTGSKIVVDIYAAILGTTGQDIFNCVNVTSDEHPEGNTSNTTIHVNIADLEIIKIVDNLTPNYGDEITYTIIVRNNGPDNSTNIKVSEILADNFKFISANASKGYYNLTNGIWAVGNLTNNETAKLVITVKIIKTGFIQNNVSVNGTGYDPNLTNNNATVNITVPQTADLSVIKIVNVNVVTVGDKIIYTIIVKNNGPDTALDIYVVDKLSDALKFVSYKASVGVYNPTTGIWTIGNLTNKSNATLEITCIVLKTGIISNEVFVNGSTVDLNMSNNYDNISVTVNPLPTPVPTPVSPADKDIMISDEVTMDIAAMAKTGNPLFALLVVLIFGIFGFGVSRRKK